METISVTGPHGRQRVSTEARCTPTNTQRCALARCQSLNQPHLTLLGPVAPGIAPQSPRAPPAEDEVLLTGTQTRARFGDVSAMCIWRWMRDPHVQFSAPIKINARNYWRLGDLRRWHAERIAKAETPTGEE